MVRVWWRCICWHWPFFWTMKERRNWGQLVGIRHEEQGPPFSGIPVVLDNYTIQTKYNLRKMCFLQLVLIRMHLIWCWILIEGKILVQWLSLLMLICMLHKIYFLLVQQHSLSSLYFSLQPRTASPGHNALFSIPECVGKFFTPFPFVPIFPSLVISSSRLILKRKCFLALCLQLSCLHLFLYGLIYSYGCWGLSSWQIEPFLSLEFQMWFDMAHRTPPDECIYSVTHLLI